MIATRWRGKQWVGLPRPPSCTHGNSLSSSEKEGESVNVASSPTKCSGTRGQSGIQLLDEPWEVALLSHTSSTCCLVTPAVTLATVGKLVLGIVFGDCARICESRVEESCSSSEICVHLDTKSNAAS